MSTRIKYATAFIFLVAAGLDSVILQPALSQANSPGEQQAAAAQNCPVSRERLVDALKKSVKAERWPQQWRLR